MSNISAYRLTVIGALVVIVLSVGVVSVLGGIDTAAPYLQLVGTVAIPALLALFKLEQNSRVIAGQHEQNQSAIADTNSKIDALATALESAKK